MEMASILIYHDIRQLCTRNSTMFPLGQQVHVELTSNPVKQLGGTETDPYLAAVANVRAHKRRQGYAATVTPATLLGLIGSPSRTSGPSGAGSPSEKAV